MLPAGKRTVHDPYATLFLQSWKYRTLVARLPERATIAAAKLYNKFFAGFTAGIILRQRHFEAVLAERLRAGCRQIVILGAGYDSTAARNDFPPDVRVYEIDKPQTQERKQRILRRHLPQAEPRVVYVDCDFDAGERFEERLIHAGFDPQAPALISWLGVSYYLTPAAVSQTLKALAVLCHHDTQVLVDYFEPEVVDGTASLPCARRGARFTARRGEPFQFGMAHGSAARFFGDHGFTVTDHYRISDLADRYTDRAEFWLTVHDFMGGVTLRPTRTLR